MTTLHFKDRLTRSDINLINKTFKGQYIKISWWFGQDKRSCIGKYQKYTKDNRGNQCALCFYGMDTTGGYLYGKDADFGLNDNDIDFASAEEIEMLEKLHKKYHTEQYK